MAGVRNEPGLSACADALLEMMSVRYLSSGDAAALPLPDPSDHFSHDDSSIPAVNFLRFSDDEWERWAGNQFMYQNRLRSPQYIDLFERAGVHMLRLKTAVDTPSLAALSSGFVPAERFAGMTAEELATTQLWVMGQFDST